MAETLKDVFVNHEALIFRRGRIYPESFVPISWHAAHYDRLSVYGWFLLKNYWLRRGSVQVPSGLWVIDNWSPDNYHHWLVDVLPRILRAEEEHPDVRTVLLPRYYRNQSYICFMLEAFPNIDRVAWIGDRVKARVNQLAFVPRQLGDRLIGQIGEVANRVAAIAGEPGTARGIYFSRSDARWRKARNEEDVVRVLRAHGIEPVAMDPAKPWEQIRAAKGARLMVGVHGAALTNLIFMEPGSTLLELRHENDETFSACYRWLAECLGIEYSPLTCQLAELAGGLAINDSDLIVDLDLLRERLRAIGFAPLSR